MAPSEPRLVVSVETPEPGCTVVRLVGECDNYTAPLFREKVREQAGADRLALDCSGLTFVDAGFLQALIGLDNLRKGRCRLELISPNNTIQRQIRNAGMADWVTITRP